jgi:hypothetical protein
MTTPEGQPAIRTLGPGMRGILLVGAVLVLTAGIQLFILTDHTDTVFAWTIKVPVTAAFLGAFYFTAMVLALLSARERVWANARVAVLGVFTFIVLTLLATLLHFDQFHFHAGGSVARGAAWLWLAIYAGDPPAILVLLLFQLRRPGGDPPRLHRLERWYRGLLLLLGLVALGMGIALFVAPDAAKKAWSWALTPLTARAVAAWLIGLGLVALAAVREDDWDRIRPVTYGLVTLGLLQSIALARYGDEVRWGSPTAWVFVAFLLVVLLAGAFGVVKARSVRERTYLRPASDPAGRSAPQGLGIGAK